MSKSLETLNASLQESLGGRLVSVVTALEELTIVVKAEDLVSVCTTLRDDDQLHFEQLIDITGIDYSEYGDGAYEGPRFASIYHLLSLKHNWRLRLRVYAPEDDFPVLESVIGVWDCANWYEREAFDLYGIMYTGHPDLRRILTDYGFVGHPFRKDFPLSGNVEMRYDPDQKRVIYQPVTIEPRVITPRIVREDNYADSEGFRKG